MIKLLILRHKFKDNFPYFQIIIFSKDAEVKLKIKDRGLIMFITSDPLDVVALLNNFHRRIEKYAGGEENIREFTDPFAAGEHLIQTLFIREAGSRFKFKFTPEEIKEQLLSLQEGNKTKKLYAVAEIEQDADWLIETKLFTIYTKECFIYRETNRRLRKYVNLIPQDIFLPHNLDQIKNLTYENKAFKKLIPVLPFTIELNKQIEQFNSPGIFSKDLRIVGGTLWRGINLNEELISKFYDSIGCKIGFPAFSSSTKDKNVAYKFPGNTIIKVTFSSPNEAFVYPIDISIFSIYKREAEVLFPAGSEFIIKNISPEGSRTLINLEYVASPKIYENKIKKLENYEQINVNRFSKQILLSLANILKITTKITSVKGEFTDEMGLREVFTALMLNQTVKTIGIKCKQIITESTVLALIESLKFNKTLENIDIIDDQFENIKVFAVCFARHLANINYSGTFKLSAKEEINSLFSSLTKGENHENLDISHRTLNNKDIIILCEALKHNNSIQKIDLRRNNIKNMGAKVIAEYIEYDIQDIEINLEWNYIGIKGKSALKECKGNILYLNQNEHKLILWTRTMEGEYKPANYSGSYIGGGAFNEGGWQNFKWGNWRNNCGANWPEYFPAHEPEHPGKYKGKCATCGFNTKVFDRKSYQGQMECPALDFLL